MGVPLVLLQRKMREGRKIYDVGADKARRAPGGRGPSDIYKMEKGELAKRGYPSKALKVD